MRTCRTRATYHRNSPRGQIWPGTRRTHRMAINFQPWKNAAQLKKLEKVRGCVYFCGRVRKYNRGPIPFTRIMGTSAIYDKNTFVAIHVFPPPPPSHFCARHPFLTFSTTPNLRPNDIVVSTSFLQSRETPFSPIFLRLFSSLLPTRETREKLWRDGSRTRGERGNLFVSN